MSDTSPTPVSQQPPISRRLPAVVLLPAAAAVVILAFVFARATAATEMAMLGGAMLLLVVGHLLLRSRSSRQAAEEEARRLRAEFNLAERAADCERRREGLAAFARLASHVAHEVRNPLSSIALNAEMLGDEIEQCHCPASGSMKGLLSSIGSEVARLHRLTDEYLLVARAPSLALAPSDLNAVVRSLAGFVREEASRAGVSVETDLDVAAAAVTIDADQVRQATLNLVRNAIQAMPGGGRMRLATESGGDRVRLSVADTGPGVPIDQRFVVFEPFFSTKEGGTGLGLPLAMQIAREHGGMIELDGWTGGGACFTITLPRDGVGPLDSITPEPPGSEVRDRP